MHLSVRELVASSVLIERELIIGGSFGSRIRERHGWAPDYDRLEQWDRDGVLLPLAFVSVGVVAHNRAVSSRRRSASLAVVEKARAPAAAEALVKAPASELR
ncbi:MAG: hypothetical protein ACXWNR_05380 [Candidatus Limnocylindrales bacterium]